MEQRASRIKLPHLYSVSSLGAWSNGLRPVRHRWSTNPKATQPRQKRTNPNAAVTVFPLHTPNRAERHTTANCRCGKALRGKPRSRYRFTTHRATRIFALLRPNECSIIALPLRGSTSDASGLQSSHLFRTRGLSVCCRDAARSCRDSLRPQGRLERPGESKRSMVLSARNECLAACRRLARLSR